MPDFYKGFGVDTNSSVSQLIRDTAAMNASMNDPENWRKRRKLKLEEYDLPKIEAEGRQNILRQEAANVPDLRKLDWEKSQEYIERQLDLIGEKNVPEIMTAKTNAAYKDYLTGPVKHGRDIENTMAEQVYQIRGQDLQREDAERQAAAVTAANKHLAETSAYGGTDPTQRVAGPPGTTAPNVLASERERGPNNPLVPTPITEAGKSWTAQPWWKTSPIWNKESWTLDMDAKPASSRAATVPETSKIDSMAGTRSDQVIQNSLNPPVSRPPKYYDEYLESGTQAPATEQNVFEKYGTAPTPGTYLGNLAESEWRQKNRRFQRRRNRELVED